MIDKILDFIVPVKLRGKHMGVVMESGVKIMFLGKFYFLLMSCQQLDGYCYIPLVLAIFVHYARYAHYF